MRRLSKTEEYFLNCYTINQKTNCWEWAGVIHSTGYGQININCRSIYAHIYFYTLKVGLIPSDSELHHRCNNKLCVNTEHLEIVSHRQNMLEFTKQQTHCKQGHLLSLENCYTNNKGWRICKICMRRRNQVCYLKRREAIKRVSEVSS